MRNKVMAFCLSMIVLSPISSWAEPNPDNFPGIPLKPVASPVKTKSIAPFVPSQDLTKPASTIKTAEETKPQAAAKPAAVQTQAQTPAPAEGKHVDIPAPSVLRGGYLPDAVAPADSAPPPVFQSETVDSIQRRITQTTDGLYRKDYQTKSVIDVKPGENVVIDVSVGQLNRIITPFPNPKVHTVSEAPFTVEESVIYLAPSNSSPITMFVTDTSSETQAVSILFKPLSIPPREVTLSMDGFSELPRTLTQVSEEAGVWERSQEYADTLTSLMREVAYGKIPQGYGLRDYGSTDARIQCDMKGVEVIPRQVVEGQRVFVVIALLKNVSDGMIEFDEASCYSEGVLAVATWPYLKLDPRSVSELYIARRIASPKEQMQRPSLLSIVEGHK